MKTNAITVSQLKEMGRSPAHFKWAVENPEIEDDLKKAMLVTKIFKPAEYDAKFITSDVKMNNKAASIIEEENYLVFTGAVKRGKAWDALKQEAEDKSMMILTKKEYDEGMFTKEVLDAGAVIVSYKMDEEVKQMAIVALKNQSISTIAGKENVEILIDISHQAFGISMVSTIDVIADGFPYIFKIMKDCKENSVSRSAKINDLHMDAAMAVDAIKDRDNDCTGIGMIVVDEGMPIMSSVFHNVNNFSLMFGKAECKALIESVKACRKSGIWEGYPESYNEISLKSR